MRRDFLFFLFLLRTHTASCLCQAHSLASFPSLLVMRQGRRSEATETVFFLPTYAQKKPRHCRCVRAPIVSSGVSVRLLCFVCLRCWHYTYLTARAVRDRFPQNPGISTKAGEELGLQRGGLVSLQTVSSWPRSPRCCVVGGLFMLCFLGNAAGFVHLFFLRTHTAYYSI